MTLGRGADAQLRIDNPHVSRAHAELERLADNTYHLKDLGSHNGTRVNGEPLEGERPLAFGDRIQIGSETMLLFAPYDRLEDELARHQRNESMAQLTSGIAHNFNNLLGTMLSSLDYLDRVEPTKTLNSEDIESCHRDLRASANRATELVDQLLAFVPTDDDVTHEAVNVSELVRGAAAMLKRSFDRSIQLRVQQANRDLSTHGHPMRIRQAVMALCSNARDAMPGGGKLIIRIRTSQPADLEGTPLTPDPFIVIEVLDTGTGMDEATRRRAFDPFFTTRPHEKRSGLGLAIAFDVAQSMGGYLTCTSTPGEGSCFRFLLPLDTESMPAHSTRPMSRAAASRAIDGRSTTVVLVVDDDEMVRRATVRVLRQDGYVVLTAGDGLEAVEVYRSSDPRPDLVLLDIDMPRANGVEAYRQMRAIDPTAQILFVSGYWEQALEHQMRLEGALGFLRKPYPRAELEAFIDIARGRI